MRNIWKKYKGLILIVSIFIIIAVTVTLFLRPHPTSDKTDFGWDGSYKSLTPFGIDSSRLRTVYEYYIDPNNPNPLYINDVDDCSINSSVVNIKKQNTGDEQATIQLVSQGRTGNVQESRIMFENSSVPVKTVKYDDNGKHHAVFGRVFGQKGVQLFVDITCGSPEQLTKTLEEALYSFRVVQSPSVY